MTMRNGIGPDETASGHPTSDLLIRLLDGELSGDEVRQIRLHVSSCAACKDAYRSWAELTVHVEFFAQSLVGERPTGARKLFVNSLSGGEELVVSQSPSGPVDRRRTGRLAARRYAWVAAIAAAVVLGLAIIPREKNLITSGFHRADSSSVATLDVNGESFTLLPYSDPELPMNAPRIVEMQVPVASLAAAGVSVEPSANLSPQADRTVLANVLLGLDGQPLGIHVLSAN